MAFSTQSLAKAQEHLERMQTRMAKVRQHAEASMGQAIQSVEVGGTAFAFGYANARWGDNGELKVLGLPVDLGMGFALSGLSLMGGLGKYAEHGTNIGCGALAAFAYRSGMQFGQQAAEESGNDATASRQMPAQRSAARMNGAPVNVGYAPASPPYVNATVVETKAA